MLKFVKKLFGTAQDRLLKRYRLMVAQVNTWDEKYNSLSDSELRAKTEEFRRRFTEGESLEQLLPEAYGVIKNVCRRLCGSEVHVSGYEQKWDMVPYDVQVLGAIAMHYGSIAEMQTGEGKTLTAALPLYLNALSGKAVHLVTVNDYLARRDCEWTGSILRWLGLTTAPLTNAVPPHERQNVYKADVVYGTASEFGFDYLRDNSIASRAEDQVQRGFYFAIVDEIDSILIDEARTPLIISGPVPNSRQMYNTLKDPVASLVRQQRDLCTRLANEGRKSLEQLGLLADGAQVKLDKAGEAERQVALRKLWQVSKGTPTNRILKRVRENPDLRAEIDQVDTYFASDQVKEERHRLLAELLVMIDEKASEHELTDRGMAAWAAATGEVNAADDFVMLDLGYEYHLIDSQTDLSEEEKLAKRTAIREEDARRKERSHNLRQLLRAHLLMERDVDYILQDDKVVIIDEHTGRPQPGRRFSDGLHQAIEAKEGVAIQQETQTYATITLQNYFRMYDKLAGMTGTAMTEAGEFKEIYGLDVLEIPTYRGCQRKDFNDRVYMTEREKYNAILQEVREIHATGRPILIGTESVDVSEKLSRILRQNKLEHTVLNAKKHDSEAEIIAHAGVRNAITVSTNMAGRGTDIKLGQDVASLGGLHVIGTTRHQSRRIDRQLRGRSARLGDPGSSLFFVSFEDELMRLFASPRLNALLRRLRPPENEPISAPILNRSIETAQKRVEGRNYTIRKHTLEYDDVMNKQRHEIYSFRNEILHTTDLMVLSHDLITQVCGMMADHFFISRAQENGWNPEGYRQWLMTHFPIAFDEEIFDDDRLELEEIERRASTPIYKALESKIALENAKVALPSETEQRAGAGVATQAMRSLMLRNIDRMWQEHLLKMDHIRTEVSIRHYAQKDPLLEFKEEAFVAFEELGKELRAQIVSDLFRFEIVPFARGHLEQVLNQLQMETQRTLAPQDQPVQPQQQANGPPAPIPLKSEPITVEEKVGRNDLCPCGSGKKYKKCCGAQLEVG